MLFKFMGDITCDNVPVARNLRVNFMPNRQIRFKIDLVDGSEIHSVDLFVSNYTNLQFSIPNISVQITGQNVKDDKDIKLKVSFNYLEKSWKVDGCVGVAPISRVFAGKASITDAVVVLNDIIGVNIKNICEHRSGAQRRRK